MSERKGIMTSFESSLTKASADQVGAMDFLNTCFVDEINNPGSRAASPDAACARSISVPGQGRQEPNLMLAGLELLPPCSNGVADIDGAARDIHAELQTRTLWGWGWISPHSEIITSALSALVPQDCRLVEQAYEKQYGHKLRADLSRSFSPGSSQFDAIEQILNGDDPDAINASKIHAGLAKLSRISFLPCNPEMGVSPGADYGGILAHEREKADLFWMMGSMSTRQLGQTSEAYLQLYGQDLQHAIADSKELLATEKKRLLSLFKGSE
jgi:hypothetical protein